MDNGRDELISFGSININPGKHDECISSVEHNPFPGISVISDWLHIGMAAHSSGVGGGKLQMSIYSKSRNDYPTILKIV